MGAILLIVFLFLFIFMGIPVAFAVGLASTIVILMFEVVSPTFQARSVIMVLESFPLLAIPLFVLAGDLMNTGGLSKRLISFVETLMGSFKANLAYVTVLASCFFAAISGSGPATVAAIGGNVIPEMEKRGYPKDYATGVPTVSGMVGVLIPPSIPFIMFGLAAEVSVGRLFLAGIGPGIVFALGIAITARIMYGKLGLALPVKPFSFNAFVTAFKEAFLALLAPIIVLGGIYGGIFSPTEAAAVACLYAIIVGLIYREFTVSNLIEAFRKATSTCAMVMSVVAFAGAFGRIVTLEGMPAMLTNLLTGITESQVIILLILNVLMLVIGATMDTTAAIIIMTPVLFPIARSFGIDPTLFGVIMVSNLAIGFITPPVGYSLFVAGSIANLPIGKVIRAVAPYMITVLVVLMLVTFVPAISLTIPRLVFGM